MDSPMNLLICLMQFKILASKQEDWGSVDKNFAWIRQDWQKEMNREDRCNLWEITGDSEHAHNAFSALKILEVQQMWDNFCITAFASGTMY